jgi:hypothetical protein
MEALNLVNQSQILWNLGSTLEEYLRFALETVAVQLVDAGREHHER